MTHIKDLDSWDLPTPVLAPRHSLGVGSSEGVVLAKVQSEARLNRFLELREVQLRWLSNNCKPAKFSNGGCPPIAILPGGLRSREPPTCNFWSAPRREANAPARPWSEGIANAVSLFLLFLLLLRKSATPCAILDFRILSLDLFCGVPVAMSPNHRAGPNGSWVAVAKSLQNEGSFFGRGSRTARPRQQSSRSWKKKNMRRDVFMKRTKMIQDDLRKSQLSAAQCSSNLTTWTLDKQFDRKRSKGFPWIMW